MLIVNIIDEDLLEEELCILGLTPQGRKLLDSVNYDFRTLYTIYCEKFYTMTPNVPFKYKINQDVNVY